MIVTCKGFVPHLALREQLSPTPQVSQSLYRQGQYRRSTQNGYCRHHHALLAINGGWPGRESDMC